MRSVFLTAIFAALLLAATAPAAMADPPAVSVTSPTAFASINSADVTVAFDASGDAPLTIECALDGGTPVACADEIAYTGLSEGTHTVEVSATDELLNSAMASVTFTVDLTPPTIALSSPVAGATNDDTPTVAGTTDVPDGSSVEVTEGANPVCTATVASGAFTCDAAALGEGTFTLLATVSDAATNSASDTVTIDVDLTAPVVDFDTPAGGSWSQSDSVATTFSVIEVNVASVECRADSDAAVPCGSETDFTFAGLADGARVLKVLVIDAAGNSDEASITVNVDTIDPALTVTAPTGGEWITSGTVDLEFSATDANALEFSCQLDAESPVACTSATSHSFTDVADGNDRTVTVTATDASGRSDTETIAFQVDKTAPVVSFTSPADNSWSQSNSVDTTFTVTEANVASVTCQVDSDAAVPCGSETGFTFAGLDEGARVLKVLVTDQAGNFDEASLTVNVDTIDPALTITSPLAGAWLDSGSVDVSFSATDANSLSLTCEITGQSAVPCDSGADHTFSGVADGSRTISVTATDPSGRSVTESVVVNVDQTDPVVAFTSPSDNSWSQSDSVATTFTVTEANVASVTCQVDSDAAVPCGSETGFTFAGLADGARELTVLVSDQAGNSAEATRIVNVDTIDPLLSISSPLAGAWIDSNSVSVSFSATDANSLTLTCEISGQTAVACDSGSSHTITGVTDGSRTITVTATDVSGRSVTESVVVNVDQTDPVVAFASPADNSWSQSSSVATTFGVTEANVASVECQVDSASPVSCDSQTGFTFAGLAEGDRVLKVLVTDLAGNSAEATRTVRIDTIDPALSISSPLAGAWLDSGSVPVSFSASDTNPLTLACEITDQSAVPCEAGSSHTFLGVTDGARTITVTATDPSGRSVTENVVVNVDQTDPIVAFDSPAHNSWSQSDSVAATFTVDEANVASVECQVDSDGAVPCGSETEFTFSGLADGARVLKVLVIDAAGNSDEASITVNVDTIDPALTVTAPTGGEWITSGTVDLEFSATDANALEFSCQLDAESPVACTSATSHSFTDVADGNDRTVTVTATDASGRSDTETIAFQVDKTAPVVSFTSPADNSWSQSNSVDTTFTVTEANVASVTCQVDSDAAVPCGSETGFTFAGLDEGARVLKVLVTDQAGNFDEASLTVNVDTIDPALTITSPLAGAWLDSGSVDVSFSATDANSLSLTCEITGQSAVPCDSGADHTFSGVADGSRTISVTATDPSGRSVTENVAVNVDQTDPVVAFTSPANNSWSQSASVDSTFTVTEANVASVECQVDSDAAEPCGSETEFTFNVLADGARVLKVLVTDQAGNSAEVSLTVNVDTIDPVLSISSPAAGAWLDSSSVGVSFSATDANSLSLTCQISGQSALPCDSGSGHTFTGVGDGSRTITVTATDPSGRSVTDSVAVSVDNSEPEVAFTSPANNSWSQSASVTTTFAVTEVNVSSVTCQVDSATPIACGSQTGFTFTDLADGSRTLKVSVTDEAGNSTQATRTVRVDTIDPTLSITSPTDGFFADDTTTATAFTAADTNGVTTSCKLDDGAFAACTSPASQTGLSQGNHTVTVRATDPSGRSIEDDVTFTVDTVDPAVAISYPHDDDHEYVNNETNPDALYSATDVNIDQIVCKINDVEVDDNCSPSSFDISTLPDGQHTFRVEATDRAGNHFGVESTFVVDTIDPTVAISSPVAGSFIAQKSISKAFTTDDTHPDSVDCRLDGGAYEPCTNPRTYGGLGEGAHTAFVRARDLAGNETVRSVQFVIDTIKPAVSIGSPANGQTLFGSSVGVTFGAADATAVRYECSANDGAFVPCVSPFSISGLDDGVHTSTVRAIDQAGNSSANGVQFAVDLTSPDTAEKFGVAKPKGRTPRKLTRRSKLIFRDEFSGNALNRRKWSNLRGTLKFPYTSAYNAKKESASYARENANVQNGKAVLTLKRKPSSTDRRNPYTSGMIHSGNHFSFRHGYVEARVKVPSCSGCWPAFWMLNAPVDEEWPPEIDIFEFFNTRKDKRPKFNVHWKAGKRNRQWGSKKYGAKRRNYTKGWHTYGLAWNKRRAQVFVDGRPGPIYKTGRNLPKKANYLIFNLALQKGFKPRGENRMYIDYVRVWK